MILRLLIAASLVLAISQYYLKDSSKAQTIHPKQQIEQVTQELDRINQEAEAKRKAALDELDL